MSASDPKMNNIQQQASSSTIVQSPARTISVQSTGEAQCPPSHLTFGVSVYSVKDSLEAAQGSVKRRTDYIIQVLRNNGLKEKDYKCSTDISRRGECVRVQTDVLIDFDGVSKCETVRNLLIEKLDASSVQITAITCQHLFEDKEEKRQEAFKRAVGNARSKAQSVCQMLSVQLGPALEVVELDTTTGLDSVSDLEIRESDPPQTELLSTNLHLQFVKETLTFRSQVSVVFETQPNHTCTHKKCKKH